MNSIIINFKTMEEVEYFTNLMSKYDENIDVKYGRYVVDGKSYLGILALGLCKDLKIEFSDYNEQLIEELNNFRRRIINERNFS